MENILKDFLKFKLSLANTPKRNQSIAILYKSLNEINPSIYNLEYFKKLYNA
tara:strand:+ start:151 stop:306 length:156 start_codon:yes stop_codon:yes gene_type:complete